jgi:hypothetical protein
VGGGARAFQASVDDAPSASGFEGLGIACRWIGEQEAAIGALHRAYRLHRGAGDARAGGALPIVAAAAALARAQAARRRAWVPAMGTSESSP